MVMRKLITLLILLILGISCRRENPFTSLSGTVYYEGIAIPVEDVRVKVNQGIGYSGPDGSYIIPEIRKGIYMLRAEKEGFDPVYYEMEFLKDTVFQNIQMVSEIFTSSISGNMYGDYSGEPRIGLRCVIMNPNRTESRLEAITDTSGFFEISGIPEGYHSIKVFDNKKEVYQDWIEVGGGDINYDIVFADVFKFEVGMLMRPKRQRIIINMESCIIGRQPSMPVLRDGACQQTKIGKAWRSFLEWMILKQKWIVGGIPDMLEKN